jgi:hypothetical protein
VIQPDGRIVVSGYPITAEGTYFSLVRYLGSGSLDIGFGVRGVVVSRVQGLALDLALQPDGRIVLPK